MASLNPERANRVIQFIEKLTIGAGTDAGKPFILRDWQKSFIRDVYEPVRDDGRRTVRRAIFSLARKQGKSELAGALLLCSLVGPESESFGECYSIANDRQQASIVFSAMKRFIHYSNSLQRALRVVDSTKSIYVTRSDIRGAGSKYRALSSDAGRQHGLSPSFVLVDEASQSKSRELFDTMATSQGARAEPLIMIISTRAADPEHFLEQMIRDGLNSNDPTTVCHLHCSDEGCDLLDESQWFKANPALGDFLSIEDFRNDALRAKRMPSEETAFRNLRLNQCVDQASTMVARHDWQACYSEGLELVAGEDIFLAYDHAFQTDLAALVAISAHDGSRVKSWFWKPSFYIQDHSARDGCRYDLWAQEGWLIPTDGRVINPLAIALKMAELCSEYNVVAMAWDRFGTRVIERELDNIGLEYHFEGKGFNGLEIVPWGQGWVSMNVAVNAFEAAILEGDLKHDGNKVLTRCVMNAEVLTDPAGNRKLNKGKVTNRIDGAVALAMALGLKSVRKDSVQASNPWEDPGFSINGWLNTAA